MGATGMLQCDALQALRVATQNKLIPTGSFTIDSARASYGASWS